MSSSALAVGIVGLPNVGKSTLFNALLQREAAWVANYPFTTIEPNVGRVAVPDECLNQLAEIVRPQKIIPTLVEFIDIAGLVKNAHQGEGLGNQFLAKIREVSVVLQVVRVFADENVSHVGGKINPIEDVKTIQTELALADLETLKKHLSKLEQESRGKKADDLIFTQIQFWQRVERELGKADWQRTFLCEIKENWQLELPLLSLKPQILVLNVSEEQLEKFVNKKDDYLVYLEAEIKKLLPQAPLILICAKLEADLVSLSVEEQTEYRESLGLKNSGLEKLIQSAYQLLDLVTFYTTQNQILQAWSLKKDSTALQAASLIHTDFSKDFIRAEVVSSDRFSAAKGFEAAREKGWAKIEGKDYLVRDKDVIYFKVK